MVEARCQRWGGPAKSAALRLSAFGLLLPMALALSAAERSAPARTMDDDALTQAYGDAIRARVLEHWLRPASVLPGQRCSVRILQLPSGTVIDVQAQPECQFDAVGRTSLEDAVRRAQPLPSKGFERVYVRNLQLTFVAE
ncbi:TonB C-terminal domain-containing protein [Stenotrophomonas sp. SPM]|uniref:TonB C-terminal domain-containing protein n=1 Tax=Stenotrophomonas sp. SPM TaxID=2170735 RepID=UPI0014023E87|nr:TonB C-terminal domain-containing protein [Stenotrophomonas sp. SPM]